MGAVEPQSTARAKQRAFLIAALEKGEDLSELRGAAAHRRRRHRRADSSSTASRRTRTPTWAPGKLEEVKDELKRDRRERGRRRRRALAAPGAQPREGARHAGRRPHRDDPRHLRPPRAHRRGQAPGRARAARVQHGPHARPVDAPRLAGRRHRLGRRRRRDPWPGRVARSRPTAAWRRDRISALKRRLGEVKSSRATMRAERERAHLPQIALAGYTNAGKSTLLNRMTGSDVGVRDRLFHTLDPSTRQLRAQRPPVPAHRHRRVHPQAARISSSRRSARRSRRRASPT